MKMPEILRGRLVRAIAALFVIAWLAIAAWYGYDAVLSHPVGKVVFAGAIERLPPAELEALSRSVRAAPGRPSLESVRQAARHIHWVRDAGVRRISADTLEIRFEAHEPFARWNDDALVSRRGEIFVAEYGGDLPQLRGAEGTAAQMVQEYPRLAAALEPLGSPLAELRLTPRGAWQATLASGLVLELGRNDLEARIARLASVWPELQARAAAPVHIDLRYPNGFALQPSRQPQSQPKKKA